MAQLEKPFTHGYWHAWQGVAGVLLSDESRKRLHSFASVDNAINWLWLDGHQTAARALAAHVKTTA